ncbi:MAG: CPBP family intramembrane metalloprotease [Spirochaetales bacterium]|nr:CPBP family intramembrane metalloprotease [Spirochaetales bacterium]
MILRISIFYIITFIFTIVIGGTQEALGVSSNLAILPQLAPGVAALLMVLIFRREGFRFNFKEIFPQRLISAIIVPAGAAVIIFIFYFYIFKLAPPAKLSSVSWAMIFWMPLGALGEELGWRGYLQKVLSERYSPLFGAVITGILWAAWHVGIYQNGSSYFIFFVLLIVSYSVVMGFICGSGFNVLIAAVFHFMINFTNLFSLNSIGSLEFMVISSLVWAVPAGFILFREGLYKAK